MNETVILNLKQAINQLKKEISVKQNELDELIDKYQQLCGIELDEDSTDVDLDEYNNKE